MKILLILSFLLNLGFVSCQQKKLIVKIKTLKPQELRIYFDKEGYSKLEYDSEGNVTINFDSVKTILTSSKIDEIKNFRNLFCIDDKNICMTDEHEWESYGFSINGYSHFTSDTTNKNDYVNPYHVFLIEKTQ